MSRAWRRRSALLVVSLLLVAGALVGASSEQGNGPDLAGTQPADGRGNPLFPAFRNESAAGQFLNPSRCATCHANFRQPDQKIYEPFNAWAGSMMANSARDPLFWAALDIANQDDRKHLGNVGVGDFCLRCHVPKAWYEGRSDCNTVYGQKFDGACLVGPPSRRDNDFEGLTCAVCHRSYDASQPPLPGDPIDDRAPYDENGQIYLTRNTATNLGPFSDAQSPGHGTVASPLHQSSAFCGQCHNITNPVKNQRDSVSGSDLGRLFPIERTYREWQNSRFARDNRNCQSCHMPEPDLDGDNTPDPGYACSAPPGIRGRDTNLEGPLHVHFFRGGGVWMQSLLKGEYGDALRRNESFDAAIGSSLQMLQGQTASISISLPRMLRPDTSLKATVRVTNHAGHKFPTGYSEGRRAWIHIAAGEDRNQDGRLDSDEISFESGAYDAATGDLGRDEQLKRYEFLAGVWNYNGDGHCDHVDADSHREMFHFVLNDCIVKDNRIPPLGFVPDEETVPVGATYAENPAVPGTLVNWDETTYRVPVPKGTYKALIVVASLFYQTVSKEYIEFLKDANESSCDPTDHLCDPTQVNDLPNRGEKMFELWQKYGRSAPVLIAQDVKKIRVSQTGGRATGAGSGTGSVTALTGKPLITVVGQPPH